MELKYQAALIVAIILIAAAFYYVYVYRTANGGAGNRYAGLSFKVDPVKTVTLCPLNPSHKVHCYVDSVPMPLGRNGSRVTLHVSYAVTNTGTRDTDYPPAAIYLVVGNETVDEEPLIYPYAPGQLLYNSNREFGFNAREFIGGEFNPRSVGAAISFNFKLVYCAGCSDPVKEGLVIYEENTQACTPLSQAHC